MGALGGQSASLNLFGERIGRLEKKRSSDGKKERSKKMFDVPATGGRARWPGRLTMPKRIYTTNGRNSRKKQKKYARREKKTRRKRKKTKQAAAMREKRRRKTRKNQTVNRRTAKVKNHRQKN